MHSAHSQASIVARAKTKTNVFIAFLVLTWVTVGLRIYVRCRMLRSLGWEDWWACIALLFFTVFCSVLTYISGTGDGVQSGDTVYELFNFVVIAECFYILTHISLKISLALLYLRLVMERWQRIIVYSAAAISSVLGVAFLFYVIFQCGTRFDYLRGFVTGSCIPPERATIVAYAQASVVTGTDLVFALLPISIVRGLTLNWRAKASVWFILTLGAVGFVCSVVRFRYINAITAFDDFFWKVTTLAIWSTVEPGIGIVAASLATLKPLFKRFLDSNLIISASSILRSKRRTLNSQTMKTFEDHTMNKDYYKGSDGRIGGLGIQLHQDMV